MIALVGLAALTPPVAPSSPSSKRVDCLHGDAPAPRLLEGPRRVAVEGGPGVGVDLCLQRRLQSTIGSLARPSSRIRGRVTVLDHPLVDPPNGRRIFTCLRTMATASAIEAQSPCGRPSQAWLSTSASNNLTRLPCHTYPNARTFSATTPWIRRSTASVVSSARLPRIPSATLHALSIALRMSRAGASTLP